jgi:hypothetical protein
METSFGLAMIKIRSSLQCRFADYGKSITTHKIPTRPSTEFVFT